MLLAIDIGNTNIVFAGFKGAEIIHRWRAPSHSGLDGETDFKKLLAGHEFNAAIISSVVPDLDPVITQLCRDIGAPATFVTKDMTGLQVDLDNPDEVGADRLVNARAVIEHYSAPAIVIDFGTATTFDVIDADGHYAGGMIAPGVNLSLETLSRAAAKLPQITFEKPARATGKSTVAAMQAGAYWGYIGLIEKIIDKLCAEMDAAPFILATGGLATVFADDLPLLKAIDADLTLKGLHKIYTTMAR